ncbi:PucR family transcriptional regulator [Arthrobacter celericrescens]|uniref:PucR family transcriptional regulator n=1 Tax=Arthrobacter celericrescens TaxID=2320851 RepID=UPI000EA1106D|nr:PucR family transcriptional regulator [Arthrobacter celericrescens]
MISLAQLQHRLGAELSPCGGAVVPRRQISGVHISELEDPTPYLEGGELLLTTGIPFAGGASGGPARIRSYVGRLVERDVSALGLGLGAGLDAVPAALADTCTNAGLPLLLVPAGVPFMNVSRAYWDLVSKAGQSDLVASLGTQTALARAALLPDANASVVKALAQALGGWAAYLPAAPGGTDAETSWPSGTAGLIPQLQEQTARLNLGALHSAATFQIHGSDVVEHPVLVGRRIAGFLAVGAGRKLGKADRQIIQTVCMLLSLKAQQQQEAHAAGAALDSAVAKLLLGGHPDAARMLARDLSVPLPDGPVRLLLLNGAVPDASGRGLAEEAADVVSRLRAEHPVPWLPTALRGCRLRCADGAVSAFILDAAPSNEVPAELHAAGEFPSHSAALSRVLPLHRLPEARDALIETLASLQSGTLSVPGIGHAVDAQVEEWIEALRGFRRADLVATVRSYLRHRGQWEAAARDLAVHRNSLRHRIATAARIIGADLDDPDVAARLWLGLRRS